MIRVEEKFFRIVLIITCGVVFALSARAESYLGRPDIFEVEQSEKTPVPNWEALKEGMFKFSAEILEFYPDAEIYFLARDAEYLYDLARILTKGNRPDFKRLHLLNVSTISKQDKHLVDYLKQQGLSKTQLKGKTVVFVDTGWSGSIYYHILKLIPEISSQSYVHLIESNTLPKSDLMNISVTKDPTEQPTTVKTLEDLPHYTASASGYAYQNNKWHPISKAVYESDRTRALHVMGNLRFTFDNGETRDRFEDYRVIIRRIIKLLSGQKRPSLEKLNQAIAKLDVLSRSAILKDLRGAVKNDIGVKEKHVIYAQEQQPLLDNLFSNPALVHSLTPSEAETLSLLLQEILTHVESSDMTKSQGIIFRSTLYLLKQKEWDKHPEILELVYLIAEKTDNLFELPQIFKLAPAWLKLSTGRKIFKEISLRKTNSAFRVLNYLGDKKQLKLLVPILRSIILQNKDVAAKFFNETLPATWKNADPSSSLIIAAIDSGIDFVQIKTFLTKYHIDIPEIENIVRHVIQKHKGLSSKSEIAEQLVDLIAVLQKNNEAVSKMVAWRPHATFEEVVGLLKPAVAPIIGNEFGKIRPQVGMEFEIAKGGKYIISKEYERDPGIISFSVKSGKKEYLLEVLAGEQKAVNAKEFNQEVKAAQLFEKLGINHLNIIAHGKDYVLLRNPDSHYGKDFLDSWQKQPTQYKKSKEYRELIKFLIHNSLSGVFIPNIEPDKLWYEEGESWMVTMMTGIETKLEPQVAFEKSRRVITNAWQIEIPTSLCTAVFTKGIK